MSDKEPEEKDDLLELIKKVWLPVAGFFGAVTLAYNFYQLWLGDETTVIYIAGGVGLLLLVISLVWIGFKNKTIEVDTIIYNKDQIATKKTVIQPTYEPKYRNLARAGLILVVFGIVWSGFALAQHRQVVIADHQYQSTQNAIETQQVQQELKDKLIVVIASFDGPEEIYGLRNQIIEGIAAEFSKSEDVKIIAIQDVISPDKGSEYAQNLGEEYFADLVIWGWYRPTENPNITVHIENLSPEQLPLIETSEILKPCITLEELNSFSFQQQAGQETSALISFIAGYIDYKAEKYRYAVARFDSALENLSAQPQLIKNLTDIYHYRASSYRFLKEYKRAIQDLDKAIELDPNDVWAYVSRGYIYIEQKDYDRAIQDYSKAIELDPNDADAYFNRGWVYDNLQDYNHAIQDYSKVIELNPNDACSYINRGNSHSSLKDYDRAIQDFDKAIQLEPNFSLTYAARGFTYLTLQDYDRAIQDYGKAIELDPNDADAYYNRGWIYDNLQDYDRAIQDYSRAIELDPNGADAYYNRGLSYQKLGKTAESQADFAKYKELTGQDSP